MKPKQILKIVFICFVVVLVTGLLAYKMLNPHSICGESYDCFRIIAFGYGEPVTVIFSVFVVLTALSFLLSSRMVKIVLWYLLGTVPITLILLFSSPVDCVGGLLLCLDDRATNSMFLAAGYAVLTIVFIACAGIVMLIKKHGKKTTVN